jgi:hypothetical protein
MDDDREDDKLWDLLGAAPPAQASPFFVRRVLREVRAQHPEPPVWVAVLRWFAPLGAAAAALVAVTVWFAPAVEEGDFNALFDSAADLSSLVAWEDSSWLDPN